MATAMRTRLLAAVFCTSVCGLGVTVGARQSAQVSGASVPVIINNDAPGKDETRFGSEGFVLTPVNGYAAGYMSDTAYLNNEAVPRANGANASWKFQIAANGKCTFAATWGALNKGSIDTKYTTSKTGDTPILADQSKPAPTKLDMTGDGVIDDRGWLVLGTYDVKQGETVTVTVKGGTKGYTLADAVMMNCNMTVLGDGPTSCMMPVCAPPAPGCEYVRDSAVDANGCPLRPCGELKCNTGTTQACGNGVKEGGEECDDKNRKPGDGCSTNCEIEDTCGDYVVTPSLGEECDTGSQNGVRITNWDCSRQCKWEYCGDKILQQHLGEQCDGSMDCTFNCQVAPKVACNDGKDNDGDGAIDLADAGCANAQDKNESDGSKDLFVDIRTDVRTVAKGGTIVVSASLQNAGPDNASAPVEYAITFPAGFTYDATNPSPLCSMRNDGKLVCRVEKLNVGRVTADLRFLVGQSAACGTTNFSTNIVVALLPDPNLTNHSASAGVTVECPAPQQSCTDTDGGNNPDAKGTVTLQIGSDTTTSTDECTSSYGSAYNHEEFYCDKDNTLKTSISFCPNGCADGACKKAPQDPNACAFPENKNTANQNGTLSVDVDMNGVVESRDIRLVIAAYNEVQRTNVIPTSVYDPEAQTPVLIAVKPDVDGNLTVDMQDILYVIHYVRCSVPRVSLTQANVSCVGTDTKAALTYEARNTNPLIVMLENGSWLYNGGDVTAGKTSATVTTFENVLVPAGSKIKLCDSVNKTLCSSAVTIVGSGCPKNISLAGVTLTTNGGVASAKVAYTKDPFPTCVHMFIATDKSKTLHTVNYFCSTTGETKTVPLGPTAANQNDGLKVKEGDSVVLCHGNNSGICSAPVTVTKETASSTTTLSIATKNTGTADTAVRNQKNIGLVRFEGRASGENVMLTRLVATAIAGSAANAQNYTLWSDTDYNGVVETKLQSGVAVQGNLVTFDSLTNGGQKIAADRTMIFEIRGDVASATTDTLQLDLATTTPNYVEAERSIDGLPLANIKTNGSCATAACAISVSTVPSKKYTIANQGDLFVTLDSAPTRSRQLLAGNLSDSVLRMQFRAENENINVTDLQLTSRGSRATSIDRLELYKDGATTPFALATVSGCGSDQVILSDRGIPVTTFCANMDNGELVVNKGENLDVIVKARIKNDSSGAVSGEAIQLFISPRAISNNATGEGAVRARGIVSANNLAASDNDATNEGEVFIGTDNGATNVEIAGNMNTVVFSKIVSITNANPDADNTNVPTGVSPIGQFKFTAATNGNTMNGLNKAVLNTITFDVTTTNALIDVTSFKFYNKMDSSNKKTCVVTSGGGTGGVGGGSTTTFSHSVTCADVHLGTSTSAGTPIDAELESGEQSTFVLEANVTNPKTVPSANSSLQVSLQNFSAPYPTGSNILWSDKDAIGTMQYKWIEYSDTVVRSTAYKS